MFDSSSLIRSRRRAPVLIASFFLSTVTILAQQPGQLRGAVLSADGEPVSGAVVRVANPSRSTVTGPDGAFVIESLPKGEVLVEVTSDRHGGWTGTVVVESDGARLEVQLDSVAHHEEILVTASAFERGEFDLATPTNVLTGDELLVRLQPTLGDTLAGEVGVTASSFGPGASRPVVRGLGGDRVRMLESGIGAGDASSASPDHNVATEPGNAERIEVLRGPATLLYGSSAIGGVVNVIDGLIPSSPTESTASGHADLRLASVNDEVTGSLAVGGQTGDWGWQARALSRDTGDTEIPGFAEVHHEGEEEEEDEHEEAFGVLANSDIETTSIGGGLSRFFDSGFVGVSVSGYDSNYGVPGSHGHEEEHVDDAPGVDEHTEEEGGTRIDMQRLRVDLRSEVEADFGFFQGLKARVGVVDYEHDELEPDGAVGTTFLNDAWEGRVDLLQKSRSGYNASWGLQVRSRESQAVGEEAFIPRNDALSLAAFTFQELSRGDFSFQLGGRFETQDNSTQVARDRSFSGFSASAGSVWRFHPQWSLAGSLARSVKFPAGEELYSNGPHFATQAFEVGNPDLDEETSVGVDVSLRKTEGRVRGSLTAFRNDFSDFIYQAFTGDELDELPLLAYTQDDAEFQGLEVDTRVGLWQRGHAHLDLSLFGDLVRAELADSGRPLPRIPPRRLGLGMHYSDERWSATAEVTDVDDQDRLGENETPTDGYTTVNASLGYRLYTSRVVYDLLLAGRNLTDEEARNHLSFLKDSVPLGGRDVSLSLRLSF